MVAGAALVAVLAQVEVPLWPVPITGQTLGVIVAGAALGSRRGALALTTYMLAGLAGLPVFAGGAGGVAYVLAPSFGFVLGFILSAAVAGWFAERAWDRKPWLAFIGFVVASVMPFLVGVPYMAFILDAVVRNVVPSPLQIVGVVLVMAGLIVNQWAGGRVAKAA